MMSARSWRSAVAQRVPMTVGGRTAAVALATAVVAAGCATVPTNGPVQQVGSAQNGLSQEQEYSQPIAVGPESGWKPTQIVDGFLAASASFAGDHQVAKEYLDPAAQAAWHPGWAVTVVRGRPTTTSMGPLPKSVPNQPGMRAQVKVTGLPVATITGSGQYQVYSGSSTKSYDFSLVSINGQWRIDGLPTSQGLLLTDADFQHVYQPRDLYFLSQAGNTLVPDPVFVPQQATNTELATGLVKALLQDPTGWLAGAAVTGFPSHAQPIGQVRIDGQNATVNLGGEHGKPVKATQHQLEQMAAELAWTLATSGPTPVQSVELELNNRPQRIMNSLYQDPQAYQSWMAAQPAGSSLYFVGSNSRVQALSGAGQSGAAQDERVATVPGQAGSTDTPQLSSIAISPKGTSVAGIAAGGAAVYFGALGPGASLKEWRPTSGSCTSVSWDARGDLWVTADGIVWMLPPNGGSAAPVDVPVPAGAAVTDFRVAPDGVRAVMIVHDGSSSHVEVGAITHSGQAATVQQEPVTIGAGVSQPDALSWYGTDDVVVLADSGSSSSAELYEIPLNGGPPTFIATPGAPTSVTATSPIGSVADIVIGLPGDKIMISTDLGAFQPTRAEGQSPVYPG
jgi:Lipoprotein LpqB beta-propeller domain/Sporulation and spore germination